MIRLSRLSKAFLSYFSSWIHLSKKTSRQFDWVDAGFIILVIGVVSGLIFMVEEISISEKEARNFFYNPDFIFAFARYLCSIFGQNDLTLKSPMIALHVLNMTFLYGICRYMLRKKTDSLLAVCIYALLPGVNFSALFLSHSSWIASFSLFIGYIYTRYHKIPSLLIIFVSFLDSGAFVLLLGIGIFFLAQRHYKKSLLCLICLMFNLYFYDFSISGRPQGYFLQTLGQIAMLYSPILFIYFISSVYWGLRQGFFLAYIAVSSILFCFFLSFRQSIDFYTLIPQSLIGLPVMFQCFFSEMRVRLKPFRKPYYLFAFCVVSALILQTGILLGNKFTYIFSPRPNFASSHYFSKEIAAALKDQGITAISAPENLQYQLLFYGIPKSSHFFLIPAAPHEEAAIAISYAKRVIYRFNIAKK